MQAGNAFYYSIEDLPQILPIMVQPQLVLLPNGFVPVTVENIDMIEMVNDALKGNRLIGITQPVMNGEGDCLLYSDKVADEITSPNHEEPSLYEIGCMGRITNYSEIGDGSVLISLQGVCRFRLSKKIEELSLPYPLYQVEAMVQDLEGRDHHEEIDRDTFLSIFRSYLNINNMQADWETILEAPNEVLINALSIIAPFAADEKQALLEADSLRLRAETLMAIAEKYIIKRTQGHSYALQ